MNYIIFNDTDEAQYSDTINGLKPDTLPSDPLSLLAQAIDRFNHSTPGSEQLHARSIRACLPDAWRAIAIIESQFGNENTDIHPRFTNEQYAEEAKAAGGVLRMKTIARLCNSGPDDGEEFVPMTEAQKAATLARMNASGEVNW